MLKQAPSITLISDTVNRICFCNQKIVNIPNNYFNECTKLRYVHFFRNYLQRLPNLFPIALKLRSLDFSNNFITDITSLQTTHFPRVNRIALHWNRITHFVLDSDKLPQLEEINLAHNRLTELDELYDTVSAISVPESKMFISHNPWNCSHVYAWVFESMYVYGDLVQSSDCKIDGPYLIWSPTYTSKTIICDHNKAFCDSPPALLNYTLTDNGNGTYIGYDTASESHFPS